MKRTLVAAEMGHRVGVIRMIGKESSLFQIDLTTSYLQKIEDRAF